MTDSATENTTIFHRLARAAIRHRRAVIFAWTACFLVGGYAASQLTSRLSYDFSLPGQPAYETGARIAQLFGSGGTTSPAVLVFTVPKGQRIDAHVAAITAASTDVMNQNPRVRIAIDSVSGATPVTTTNGRTMYAYLFTPAAHSLGANGVISTVVSDLAQALPREHVGLTGIDALSTGGSTKGPSVFIETLVAGVGALAVLGFVFASMLALLPLVIAAVSILSTFLVLLALSYLTPVSFIVQFLVSLVGLGVAIDYSLLVVTRWREERAHFESNDEAVVAAIASAGRAVFISGLTVAVGLLSLVVLPVPFLRSTGIGGMLIPLISVAVVLTLLPAILSSVGPRWDWPKIRNESHASRGWTAWARGVARYPWWAASAALLILAVATVPVFHLRVGQTSASAEAQRGPAHQLLVTLERGGLPEGLLTPMEILVHSHSAASTLAEVRRISGVENAFLPPGRVGTLRGESDLVIVPAQETVNSASLGSVRLVERALTRRRGVIGIAGEGPGQQAFSSAVYGNVPLLLGVLGILTFLLLARALRSVVLAAKAVVLNLVSLAATFGILTWFWQDGHGSSALYSIPATGAITFWVPITVFAFLFGLSMDYEVFILTRVREEFDAGRDTVSSVVTGLARTGRLVTSAALILFLAFASLSSAPLTDVKVLATGLGIGILLDATIIRALLVPALVVLFGRLNWWMPRALGRLLALKPAHDGAPVQRGAPW